MARRTSASLFLALLATVLCAGDAARAVDAAPAVNAPAAPAKRVCIAENETREEIKAHHLLEPFVVLKSASASLKAEALRARLCQIGDEFVYEITLLHHDGHVVHAVMSAVTGKRIVLHNAHETPPRP
jgi:hypothetical protein